MADEEYLLVLMVVLQHFLYWLHKKILGILQTHRVFRQFSWQPHASDLPHHDISKLKQKIDNGEIHQRRPSKPMPQKYTFSLHLLLLSLNKDSMQKFLCINWNFINFKFNAKILEYVQLDLMNPTFLISLFQYTL